MWVGPQGPVTDYPGPQGSPVTKRQQRKTKDNAIWESWRQKRKNVGKSGGDQESRCLRSQDHRFRSEGLAENPDSHFSLLHQKIRTFKIGETARSVMCLLGKRGDPSPTPAPVERIRCGGAGSGGSLGLSAQQPSLTSKLRLQWETLSLNTRWDSVGRWFSG